MKIPACKAIDRAAVEPCGTEVASSYYPPFIPSLGMLQENRMTKCGNGPKSVVVSVA